VETLDVQKTTLDDLGCTAASCRAHTFLRRSWKCFFWTSNASGSTNFLRWNFKFKFKLDSASSNLQAWRVVCSNGVARRHSFITAQPIWERLVLVPGQYGFAHFFTMPSAPTPLHLIVQLFFDFLTLAFFRKVGLNKNKIYYWNLW